MGCGAGKAELKPSQHQPALETPPETQKPAEATQAVLASSPNGVKAIKDGIQALKASGTSVDLHELQLSSMGIEDAGVALLAEELPNSSTLETLNLGVNQVTDVGVESLAKSLPATRLKMLSLERNSLTASGVKLLVRSLPSNLEKLMLGRNRIGLEGTQAVAEFVLRREQPLHTLGLGFGELKEDGAQAIAPALSNLKVLDLSGNHLGSKGSVFLAEKLRGGTGLEILKLESDGVGDEGAKALADAIATHKTLKELVLRRNSITDVGARSLSNISASTSLIMLDLLDNSITDVGASVLLQKLRGTSLRKLNLEVNELSSGMQAKIAEAFPKK